MRYYWGLAIGHTYTHTQQTSSFNALSVPGPSQEDNDDQIVDEARNEELTTNTGNEPEYSLENLEDECTQADEEQADDNDNLTTRSSDIELSTYQEMYE